MAYRLDRGRDMIESTEYLREEISSLSYKLYISQKEKESLKNEINFLQSEIDNLKSRTLLDYIFKRRN